MIILKLIKEKQIMLFELKTNKKLSKILSYLLII